MGVHDISGRNAFDVALELANAELRRLKVNEEPNFGETFAKYYALVKYLENLPSRDLVGLIDPEILKKIKG